MYVDRAARSMNVASKSESGTEDTPWLGSHTQIVPGTIDWSLTIVLEKMST